jgi:hypothetical protein
MNIHLHINLRAWLVEAMTASQELKTGATGCTVDQISCCATPKPRTHIPQKFRRSDNSVLRITTLYHDMQMAFFACLERLLKRCSKLLIGTQCWPVQASDPASGGAIIAIATMSPTSHLSK